MRTPSTDRWYHGHLHISEYSRQVFGHVSNPRAHVIYGGVDIDKFSPDAIVPRTPTVLFVGRLLAHKGIDILVDAIDEGLSLEVIGRPRAPSSSSMSTSRRFSWRNTRRTSSSARGELRCA